MNSQAKALTFLADESCVEIPFFQREYVWTQRNWDDLLTDLLEFKKSHFLGSLILKQTKPVTGEPKKVLVIDGQQRLTTLSILIKAIYDLFDEETKKNASAELIKYLFYKKYATDKNYNIKISHSRLDRGDFKKIIGSVEDNIITSYSEVDSINENSSNILKCYKFFFDELKQKDEETRDNLFNMLLNPEKKILVIIDLDSDDNEQSIFDTINSAGIRLTGTDIVKNALFQRAIELYGNKAAIDYYKEYWEKVFIKDEEERAFWNTQKATGRLLRDNSEILLQTIAIIKGIFDPEKNSLSDLPDLYKEQINNSNEVSLKILIEDIKNYADIYRTYIPNFDSSSLFSYEDKLNRLFHILNVCEISTFHPYIIYLIKEYGVDSPDCISRIQLLEQYVIKRFIAKENSKNYNKLCKDLILDDSLLKDMAQEIDSIKILNSIKSIPNKTATLILFWIELYRRYSDSKQAVKELKYNYSLEHIMPQKWEEFWSNVPVYDENNQVIKNEDDAKIKRYSRIYSLGNMTLLNSKLNTSLRNYQFSRKIEGEGRKKGIRSYGDLSITKDDILNPYDDGDKNWDERNINKRELKLFQEIKTIWNIQ